MIPNNTKVYYASAKFRELQLDKIMNGDPMPDFPVSKNFFVGRCSDVLSYTCTVNDMDTYYVNLQSGDTYIKKNFHVTHAYKTKRDVNLINLMDKDTISYLLFDDTLSPFHVSKINVPVHQDEDPYNQIRNNIRATQLLKKYGVDIKGLDNTSFRYSGFVLLIAATSFHEEVTRRYSSIFFDYTMIELLRRYVKGVIDGWYQPPTPTFHVEYALFDPLDTLEANYDDPISWVHHVNTEGMVLKQKLKMRLDIIKNWREEAIANSQHIIGQYQQQLEDFQKNGTDDPAYIEEVEYSGKDLSAREYIEQIHMLIQMEQDTIKRIKTKQPNVASLYGFLGITQTRIKNGLQKYYNRKIKTCKYGACARPPSLEGTKCQSTLNALAAEMRLYPNANNNHHRGATVSDHSIWVARTMHRWLGYRNHPWTYDIAEELRNVALIAAFLHDIGKIGDRDVRTLPEKHLKRDHPYIGFNYIMRWMEFKLQGGSETETGAATELTPLDVLQNCYFHSSFHKAVIATTVAMHHHLGELLMSVHHYLPKYIGITKHEKNFPAILNISLTRYFYHPALSKSNLLSDVLSTMVEFKYILYYFDFLHHYQLAGGNLGDKDQVMQALLIVLGVSAADAYGSHPVSNTTQEYSVYEAPLSQLLDPQILDNVTREHRDTEYPEIFRGYYNFLYYTIGLRERENIIAFARTVNNPKGFLQTWYQFREFMNHVTDPDTMDSMESMELSGLYTRLDVSDITSLLTTLLRLLKTGEVERGQCVYAIPTALRIQLSEESSEDQMHPLAKQFITHRHHDLMEAELGTIPMSKVPKDDRQYGRYGQAPF